ncbi:NifU family protein [Nonomuraea sp. NPDC048916]|uniref:NifU family protein n=1 Tax=Nonomuraea sp. NPDC048916 TaxID=3154232 RepID=UPI0033FD6641
MDDHDLAGRVGRVEALLDEVTDPRGVELIQALLDLYGEALSRVMTAASAAGDGLPERLAADQLVSHLLLLHGLHPVDARSRIEQALRVARKRLGGGSADIVAVEPEVVRLRLRPARGGCHSTAATLTSALEQAVRAAAPEIEQVEIEVEETPAPPVVVPVESVRRITDRDRPGTPAP